MAAEGIQYSVATLLLANYYGARRAWREVGFATGVLGSTVHLWMLNTATAESWQYPDPV